MDNIHFTGSFKLFGTEGILLKRDVKAGLYLWAIRLTDGSFKVNYIVQSNNIYARRRKWVEETFALRSIVHEFNFDLGSKIKSYVPRNPEYSNDFYDSPSKLLSIQCRFLENTEFFYAELDDSDQRSRYEHNLIYKLAQFDPGYLDNRTGLKKPNPYIPSEVTFENKKIRIMVLNS